MGKSRDNIVDLFNPAYLLHKLPLWFDAFESGSMSVNASNQVASVRNKGLQGGEFVQATDANKPILEAGIINGRPALKGYNAATASSLALADDPLLNYATCSIFAVIRRHTDIGAVETIGGKYNTTGDQREHRFRTSSADDLTFDISVDGVVAGSVGSSPATDLAMDTNYIVDGLKSAAVTAAAVNANASFDIDASGTPPFNGTAPYTLFSRNANGEPFGGYIGEYLFFNQSLPTSERILVLTYLSKKWGIQLTW